MAWNSLQFMQHLNACGNRYEAENCWFGKKSWCRARVTRPASLCIAAIGLYWTLQRVFF